MSSDGSVPVRLTVGGRSLTGGASRKGQWWLVMAHDFPEHSVTGKDLAKARAELEAKLLPEVLRLEAAA